MPAWDPWCWNYLPGVVPDRQGVSRDSEVLPRWVSFGVSKSSLWISAFFKILKILKQRPIYIINSLGYLCDWYYKLYSFSVKWTVRILRQVINLWNLIFTFLMIIWYFLIIRSLFLKVFDRNQELASSTNVHVIITLFLEFRPN